MTEQPLYQLKDDRWPLLDAPEKLKDFLQRVYHEKDPELWRVRWQARCDKTVYIWYKGQPHIVASDVVDVLRDVPAPEGFIDRLINLFIRH